MMSSISQSESVSIATSKIKLNVSDELIDIDSYALIDGVKINIPFKSKYENPDKWGYVFNETEVEDELRRTGRTFDKKLYYEITSKEDYFKSTNNYMLERNLTGQTKNITSQIGKREEMQLKRFIDFSSIFGKENNLFNYTVTEKNVTVCEIMDESIPCPREINITIKETNQIPRNISHSFTKKGKSWIIEFFNLFDLDPSFIDDTDTNWNAGTFSRMFTRGTGVTANLSANNVSGHFASQVFDSVNTNANWTNISIETETPYNIEIGKHLNDSNFREKRENAINTSDLILLMHFNNETDENDSLVKDFSPDINKGKDVNNNGTWTAGAGLNTNAIFGKYSGSFDGTNDFLDVGDHALVDVATELSECAWVYHDTITADDDISAKIDSSATVGFVFHRDETGAVSGRTDMYAIRVFDSADTDSALIEGATDSSPVATWTHVCFSYLASSTTGLRMYVNGVEDANSPASTSTIAAIDAGTNVLRVGSSALNRYFDGNIDEVAVWNRSLTVAEIKNLYLRGAWRLNLSVRSCDDSVCSGETWSREFSNITNGSKQSLIDLNLAKNRYFQYNITYSNFSAYTTTASNLLNVNNVSIEFENATSGAETTPPSFSNRQPSNDSTSPDGKIQFNITITEVGGSNANMTQLWTNWTGSWTINQSGNWTDGGKHVFNLTDFGALTHIYWAVFANDSTGNFNWTQNFSMRLNTITSTTCDCPSSGDWNICDGSVCNLTSSCNIGANKLRICSNSGLLIQSGGSLYARGGCFIGNNARFHNLNRPMFCSE